MERLKGIVKWFNNSKGYGFIGRDEGADVFVHYSAISMQGYKCLREGDKVEFDVTQSEKGPIAVNGLSLQARTVDETTTTPRDRRFWDSDRIEGIRR